MYRYAKASLITSLQLFPVSGPFWSDVFEVPLWSFSAQSQAFEMSGNPFQVVEQPSKTIEITKGSFSSLSSITALAVFFSRGGRALNAAKVCF